MGSLLSTTLNTPMEPEEESGALIRKLYLLLNPRVGHWCCTVERWSRKKPGKLL